MLLLLRYHYCERWPMCRPRDACLCCRSTTTVRRCCISGAGRSSLSRACTARVLRLKERAVGADKADVVRRRCRSSVVAVRNPDKRERTRRTGQSLVCI